MKNIQFYKIFIASPIIYFIQLKVEKISLPYFCYNL